MVKSKIYMSSTVKMLLTTLIDYKEKKLSTKAQRDNLREFIERNVDHCLVPGYALLDYLEDKCQYCFGGYFYVTKEQFITPIYMMAQEAIDKVIQFRKVKNGSHKKVKR